MMLCVKLLLHDGRGCSRCFVIYLASVHTPWSNMHNMNMRRTSSMIDIQFSPAEFSCFSGQ